MKRRDLLQYGLAGCLYLPLGRHAFALAGDARADAPRLIVVMLRGGMDGLNVVVPYAEPAYYDYRPTIAIPAPKADNATPNLDGHFALHPALAPLLPYWQRKQLALLHACGLEQPIRSHFAAQDAFEFGLSHPPTRQANGWLNQLFALLPGHGDSTNAVAIGASIPRILSGSVPVSSLNPTLAATTSQAASMPATLVDHIAPLYAGSDPLGKAFRTGKAAREKMLAAFAREGQMANKNAPPASSFVLDAERLATLMRHQPSLGIGCLTLGGWDTHASQGGVSGIQARRLATLADGLDTLARGLGDTFERTVIVTLSEFGRTARQNGTEGTDHGFGNVMLVLGGAVKGGKVLGDWPGIGENELMEKRDLRVTTDYRAALKEILGEHMHVSGKDLARVFPDSARVKPTQLLL